MNADEKCIYEFGDFRLDAGELELYRHDERLALPQKSLEMLAFLIQRRGRTVTKDELLNEIWRDSFVDENNLAVNVAALRRAFGVKATDKTFIETVSRRGYRFTAEVRETNANGDLIFEKLTETRIAVSETTETLEPTKKINAMQTSLRRHSIALMAVVALVLGLGVFLVYSFRNSQQQRNSPLPNAPPRTIAVLPLKNLSGGDDEPLSIGLTDALITKLGNIRGLAVRPTSAVLPFAASGETPRAIGEKLNVEAVLESSIQRAGDRLRVSVQLVKTADGSILWSENFDETEADLFKIQDSISARVADAFRLKNPEERAANRRPEDFEAFKLYLRGRHAWNKRTPDGLRESVQYFQQAIDRDPTFALAFAGLADSYGLLSEYNTAPPRESFPQAKAAAQKALEIDPDLAEAHTTLAYALANYDWNFTEAEREYLRAIELNPNYPTAHQWYAEFLSAMRRFDEAKAEIKRAEELDPLSPIIQSIVGLIFYQSRDFDAAIAQYQKTVTDHPNFPIVYAYLSLSYAKKEMFDEAFEAEVKLLQAFGADEKTVAPLRLIYQQNGWKGFLQALLAGTNVEAQKHYVTAFSQAFLYMRMNDGEQALEWLEKSFAERHRYVVYLNADPYADFLRDDTRFQDLTKRIGINN